MADAYVGNLAGIVDARATQGDDTTQLTTPQNYASIHNAKAILKAHDATAYSDANLNTMTYNDIMYALRLHDDATSV